MLPYTLKVPKATHASETWLLRQATQKNLNLQTVGLHVYSHNIKGQRRMNASTLHELQAIRVNE